KKLEPSSASDVINWPSAVSIKAAYVEAKLRTSELLQTRLAWYENFGQSESMYTLKIWFVQAVSIFRIIAVLAFVALATNSASRILASVLYGFALLSDLLDGYLAR